VPPVSAADHDETPGKGHDLDVAKKERAALRRAQVDLQWRRNVAGSRSLDEPGAACRPRAARALTYVKGTRKREAGGLGRPKGFRGFPEGPRDARRDPRG